MDLTSAQQAVAGVYPMLADLGGFLAGILALIAGLLAYAAGVRQAKAVRSAADEQIAAIREQMEQLKGMTEDANHQRRKDLRSALAWEAARISELVAHRYRVIPMEYGPGKLETIARSACETFRIEKAAILHDSPVAIALLEKDVIAAALFLNEKIDEVNSLLTVEGALGHLPAVGLMTAYENVTDAAQRLRASTMNGSETISKPDEPARELAWLRPGASPLHLAAVEKVAR